MGEKQKKKEFTKIAGSHRANKKKKKCEEKFIKELKQYLSNVMELNVANGHFMGERERQRKNAYN